MARINSFRDLDVYAMSVQEARRVFGVTKAFPPEERFALSDQIRRSSRAVGALLAEAWARRRYPAAFVNKINEALAEAMETQAWLDHARMCDYLDDETYRNFDEAWQRIGGKLRRMEQRADTFCTPAAQ
jgi:four helix bundle protein